jgi:2-polyprenyl-6-methoxyphenol hydroxylase-like FAD-dependent oxidoreductase
VTIVVVGAGIGGLAAALGIARAGRDVQVLERADGAAELGAGIQLAPNAWRALDELGVRPSSVPGTLPVDRLTVRDLRAGTVVAALDVSGTAARYGFGYQVAHRGHLHRALLDACTAHPAVRVEHGAAVRDVVTTPQGAVVRLADGTERTGEVVVGADGLRSTVRASVRPGWEPRDVGHTAYRAVVPRDRVEVVDGRVTLWGAPEGHVVAYAVSGGREVNLVVTSTRDAGVSRPGEPVPGERVRAALGAVDGDVAALLDVPDDWRGWTLHALEPSPRWVVGRVALLGDAAHAVLQYAAQGAAMALEDAVALHRAFDAGPDDATALARYQDDRTGRTARVHEVSLWLSRMVYHAEGADREQRDRLFAALTEHDLLRSVDWLFGGGAPADVPRETALVN